MIDILIIFPILASFLVTIFLLPLWIKKAREIGLVWEDMNKLKKEKVAGSGGLIAVLGFLVGVLLYVGYRVFYLNDKSLNMISIFALLTVVLMLAGVGFIDDLFGWRRGGLSRKSRLILVGIASTPLMVIHAGLSVVDVPLFGTIDLGIVYPLVIIPLGIVGATTTFNFLAGFNGLEAGQGILLLIACATVSYLTGNSWLSVISLCMVAALCAFMIFNFYPARVFPGDSLTYAVGGLIAIIAILGNFEKIATFFFIPYIIETGLKIRGKLVKQSFGKPTKEGTLELRYEKIYGLEHLMIFLLKRIGISATEKRVVYSIWLLQLIIIVSGFIIFREGIFN